jgi:hypothetical protein
VSDIDTRADFQQAIRDAVSRAEREGWPSIALVDTDFADWPLNEPALIDALTRWALPHRRLTLVALDFDEVRRRHPRFVEWRRLWSHVVDARSPDEDAGLTELPTLLLSGGKTPFGVIVTDRVHWRGRVSHEAGDAHFYRDRLDALLQRSAPSFASTQLGL